MQGNLGEAAALGAAACWVFTSMAFAAAGRLIGATAVNLIRLFIAVAALAVINRVVTGAWIPDVDRTSLVLLAMSGLVGLAIGDQFLFVALVDVGPRLATLLMTFAPVVTAVIAWPVLDEDLRLQSIAGMTVTLAGIAWVVRDRPEGAHQRPHRHFARGIVFGCLAAVGQGVGLVLAKLGMGYGREDVAIEIDNWSVTLTRMVFGAAGMCVIAAGIRAWKRPVRMDAIQEVSPETEHLPPLAPPSGRSVWPPALVLTCFGAIFGPVLGVWLSIVAIDHAKAGIAATLMAMSPVLILPFAAWIEKERITLTAVLGACVAVAGVVILTLADPSAAAG